MDAELKFHIRSYADDLIRQGATHEDAMRRARVEFGAIEARKEECRESLGLRLWDEFRNDLRYAARTMKQNRGITAIAVISLGLGIGANTAIFTLAKEVLLKRMPVPHAERLRVFTWKLNDLGKFPAPAWGAFCPGCASPFSYQIYVDMRRTNNVMDDLVAFKDIYHLSATIDGNAESVDAMLVSGNFYQVLGAKILAGRAINPEDDSPSATPVAVISDAYWSRRFGRSADVVGKTIRLNQVPITIVGVNSPEFIGPKAGGSAVIFLPVNLQPQVIPNQKGSLLAQNYWWLMIMGRLKPGVSEQAAGTALAAGFSNSLHANLPELKDIDVPKFLLAPGSRGLDIQSMSFTKPIYFLSALAGLVLLIACANLANLLLARSASRQREMGLRLAMGASRSRVMRQVLTESMLLAILGGAAGLLLGYWGRNIIPSLFADSRHDSSIAPHMDWLVFAFAFLMTSITGLLFGIAPAWRSTQADLNSGLKESGRMTTGRPKAILGKTLVAFQVALSMLLLIGAGLFVRTLLNLHSTTIGFNPERLLLFDVDAPRSRYPAAKRVELYQHIAEKVSALRGVQASTTSGEALLADSMDRHCIRPTGRPPSSDELDSPWTNDVGPAFFETLEIPILYGRSFTARDNQHSPKVAIINQRFAKRAFPNSNPVGQTLTNCDKGDSQTPIEIVGVSADAKYWSLREDPPATLYLPYLQEDDPAGMTFELKTAASTASISSEIRDALRSVDPDLPVLNLRTQTEQIDDTLAQEKVFATLTTGFGVLALILASIGIYGIMTYTVSRRTNEIGIRMALGARSNVVLAMVLRETFLLTFIGVVAGLAAAAALTRLAASMLYGLKPHDPITFAGAALLLVAIALVAGITPARRAAKVDPMNALRHE